MSLVLQVAFVSCIVLAALEDAWRFRISNWFSIALVVVFIAAAAHHDFQINWVSHLGSGLLIFAVGALLFSRGWLGGGDVKLISTVALLSGFGALPMLLLAIALSGAAVAIVLMLLRFALPVVDGPSTRWRLLSPKAPVPYGLAICAGSLFVHGQLSLLGG